MSASTRRRLELLTGLLKTCPLFDPNALADCESIYVRSSGPNEGLEQRGQLSTKECRPVIEDVLHAIAEIWSKAGEHLLPLILQRGIHFRLRGHLSNERRVSRRHDSWLVELLNPEGALVDSHRVHPRSNLEHSIDPLAASSPREIVSVLRRVPPHDVRSVLTGPGRRHYEWVWDGVRVWVVQCDFELTHSQEAPNSRWTRRSGGSDPECDVFVTSDHATGPWQKVECVRAFQACGLPTAKLYVLETRERLNALRDGHVEQRLLEDVRRLSDLPVVVRTDIVSDELSSQVMLPRTETCTSSEQVLDFLTTTAKRLTDSGLSADQFCFLAHRFIPARAGSYSMAAPDASLVMVDGIWGVPDGLLFYPHDSFVVDRLANSVVSENVRCKVAFIDFDDDGGWFRVDGGAPWDWRASLTGNEVVEIARQAHEIARYWDCRVEVMHFVGVRPERGLPELIPWFARRAADHELPSPSSNELVARLPLPSVVVRNPNDLERAATRLQTMEGSTKRALRLRPSPEFVRSTEFLDQVADVALKYGAVIELEGSVLAHAYYVLAKRRCRLRCIGQEVANSSYVGYRAFDKLVRDHIPTVIEEHGEQAIVRRASAGELAGEMKRKLIEESFELYEADVPATVLDEAADIYEILRAILASVGFDETGLAEHADEKRREKGGFELGLLLNATFRRGIRRSERGGERLFVVENSLGAGQKGRSGRPVSVSGRVGDVVLEMSAVPARRRGEELTSIDLHEYGLDAYAEVVRTGARIIVRLRKERRDRVAEGQPTLFDNESTTHVSDESRE